MTINLKVARKQAKAEVIKRLEAGDTYESVAFGVGVSVSQVYAVAKSAGLRRSDRKARKEEEANEEANLG